MKTKSEVPLVDRPGAALWPYSPLDLQPALREAIVALLAEALASSVDTKEGLR